jgi:hypothetical protein
MVNGNIFGGETPRESKQFRICNAEAPLSGISRFDDTGKTLPGHGGRRFLQGHETLLRCSYIVNGIVFGGETARKSQQIPFCNAEAPLSGISRFDDTGKTLSDNGGR